MEKTRPYTVFVKGLGHLPDIADLSLYFSRFGSVKGVRKIAHKNIAFVDFESAASRTNAISRKIHTIGGLKLLVRECIQNQKNGGPPTKVESDEQPVCHQEIQDALRSNEDFSTQSDRFVEAVRLEDEGYKVRFEICQMLTTYLNSFIPGCQVAVFGSTLTGFGLKDSDMDLFLHVPDEFFYSLPLREEGFLANRQRNSQSLPGGLLVRDHKVVFQRIMQALRRHRLFGQLQGIPKARVPIVKFTHLPTGLHCDIQSVTSFGVANSTLLRTLFRLDVRASKLVFIIRYWAKLLGLSGGSERTKSLSNYAVCLLLVFFLMVKGVLPSVYDLQCEVPPKDRLFVEGWNVSFSSKTNFSSENIASVEYLLRDFFEFYASELDLSRYVISVKDGLPIERRAFETLDLPPSQAELVEKFKVKACRYFKIDTPLVVQDPFELDFNVASAFSEESLSKFRSCCGVAVEILSTGRRKTYLKDLFDLNNYTLEETRKRKADKWKQESGAKRRKFSDFIIAQGDAKGDTSVVDLASDDETEAVSSKYASEAKRNKVDDKVEPVDVGDESDDSDVVVI